MAEIQNTNATLYAENGHEKPRSEKLCVTSLLKGEVGLIELKGWFDIENLNRVEHEMISLMKQRPRVIGIECAELDGVDSSAIGSLVRFFNHSTLQDILLVLCDLNDALTRLFHTSKLDRYFTIMSGKEFNELYCPRGGLRGK